VQVVSSLNQAFKLLLEAMSLIYTCRRYTKAACELMRYIFSSSHSTAVVWLWETEHSVFVKGKLLDFVIANGIKKHSSRNNDNAQH
jgi:hypothetical protein